MKDVRLALSRDEDRGVVWSVHLGDELVLRTESLFPMDLALGLFEIQRDQDRSSRDMATATDEEAFFVLDHFFSGGLHDLLEELATEQTWAKHVVTPRVPTAVRASMYLVGDRFLCGRNGHLLASAPATTFDEQLTACRQELDAIVAAETASVG